MLVQFLIYFALCLLVIIVVDFIAMTINHIRGVKAVIALTAAQTAEQKLETAREGWVHRVLVAIDILGNVMFLNGYNDETISSHCARLAMVGNPFGIFMCTWLNWIQPDHGADAIAGDEERAEQVGEVEEETKMIQ